MGDSYFITSSERENSFLIDHSFFTPTYFKFTRTSHRHRLCLSCEHEHTLLSFSAYLNSPKHDHHDKLAVRILTTKKAFRTVRVLAKI